VKGLLRAVNRAMKQTVKDPDAAIDVLAAEEPLIKKDLEKRRLLYVYSNLIDTPETRDVGLGDISDKRLVSSIGTVTASFELPKTPVASEIFNRSFLPARAERTPPTVAP
jgi:NitT/TauT family transport system substrate-binding protein